MPGKPRLVAAGIDQCDPEIGPLLSPQRYRAFRQHHLERRPHDAREEMPAAGRAVGEPEHNVDVQARVAVVTNGDIADGAQHLALLVDLDLAVILRSEV